MTNTLEEIWTDDFVKFKEKVESIFGDIEMLAEKAPDVYAHMVLSHGFMEYAGVRGLFIVNALNNRKRFLSVRNAH